MKHIIIDQQPGSTPAKHYDLLARTIVDDSMGIKAMRVSRIRMEPTGRADPHTHDEAEHLFILLKGEMTMKTAQGDTQLKAGEAAFIAPGEIHSNHNSAEAETEYIVITCSLNPQG